MLTKSDYLKLLVEEADIIFFYHDRPVLYTVSHETENYLIALSDEDTANQTESYLLVKYSELTYALLQEGKLTPREFFIHPDNTAHLVVLGYTDDGLVILSGEEYEESATIPDEHLPTADARWK